MWIEALIEADERTIALAFRHHSLLQGVEPAAVMPTRAEAVSVGTTIVDWFLPIS